jgi:hypothetical protein
MKRFFTVSVMFMVLTYLSPGQGVCQEPQRESSQSKPGVALEPGLSGKVLESMDSGGYTYIQIEAANGKKLWIAVPKMKVTKGQNMSFKPGGLMKNFESKTLKRTFDEIIFSAGPIDKQQTQGETQATGSKGKIVATTENIKVEKASGENAYTVEEVYKNSESLDQKNVVIKAKVVKVSANIMNKNWLHIQDGTGDQSKGTRDLVVTTTDLPSVGDVVTVSGTLSKDKDFGAGYNYNVLIENATVAK